MGGSGKVSTLGKEMVAWSCEPSTEEGFVEVTGWAGPHLVVKMCVEISFPGPDIGPSQADFREPQIV